MLNQISNHSLRQTRHGFALIITVVLVAFLVLILVGLATFTRVETQVADNTEALSRARQNALAGLSLAVGQLQEHLGRDERVTARSELIGGVGPGNNAFITGVWNTNIAGNLPATPDAWLISGTEGAAPPNSTAGLQDASTAVSAAFDDDNGWVFVVYNNSVGTALADRPRRVRLAKQAIEVPRAAIPGLGGAGNVAIGHYAYWVGDEGVKASAAVVAPDYSTLTYDNGGTGGDAWNNAVASNTAETGATLRSRLAQFAQPYRRLDHFYPGMDYTIGSTMAELGRVTDLPQLQFVTNSVAAPATRLANFRARFHDITPLARGVLARTDAGNAAGTDRLRADLSATAAAIAPATSAVNDYWVTRPFEFSTNPPDVLGAYYRIAGRKDAAAGSNLSFSLAPVLSEAGLFVAFGPPPGGGNMSLIATVVGEFWNPYAATLRADSNLRVLVRTGPDPIEFRITDTDSTVHIITVGANTDIVSGVVAANQDFGPGAVLQFTTTDTGQFSATTVGGQVTSFNSGQPANDVDSCELPQIEAGGLIIQLQENTGSGWATLQEFALAGRDAEADVAPGGADGIVAGYGFELHRDFGLWSNPNHPSGNARDPRSADFVTDDHLAALSLGRANSNWSPNASENNVPSDVAEGAPFENASSIVLFDLPRQEIISVAQLMHMPGRRPYELIHGANDRGLFDRAFVSTVPRNAANWNYITQARPNPFLEVFMPERAPGAEIGDATDSATVVADKRRDSLRDGAISSRFQLIRGAFNINSTSSAAWAAVLGSRIEAWDTQEDAAATVNRAFFRVPHGAQEKGLANLVITNIAEDNPNAPSGALLDDASALAAIGRRLTSAEVTALADAIVAEITARGRPFASLAEFVGAPSADPSDGTRTLLQKAIDDSGVNNVLTDTPTESYRHSAGAITPADIITAIAPFMSARSDTFKIRVYGDARNPVTETVTSRAWCEAIVQRIPDLAEDPTAAAADVVRANPNDYRFGRKFQIISFRWLTSDDL